MAQIIAHETHIARNSCIQIYYLCNGIKKTPQNCVLRRFLLTCKGLYEGLHLGAGGAVGGFRNEPLLVRPLQCGVFFQCGGILHQRNAQRKGQRPAQPIGFHGITPFGLLCPKGREKISIASQSFAARRRNKIKFIFRAGMHEAKNTNSSASVELGLLKQLQLCAQQNCIARCVSRGISFKVLQRSILNDINTNTLAGTRAFVDRMRIK